MQVRLLWRQQAVSAYKIRTTRPSSGTGSLPDMLIQSMITNNKCLFIKLSLIYLYTYLFNDYTF